MLPSKLVRVAPSQLCSPGLKGLDDVFRAGQNLPAEKVLYWVVIPRGKHVPGTEGSQIFWTGMHASQINRDVTAIARFMDIRQNQTTFLTHP